MNKKQALMRIERLYKLLSCTGEYDPPFPVVHEELRMIQQSLGYIVEDVPHTNLRRVILPKGKTHLRG